MNTTLYWHDYETSGINPARDRIMQFAGLRTNQDLEVIGEPLVQYCHPPRDRLPHPQACLLTGISPQHSLAEGLPERDFVAAIHRELATPGTCGVGYNSLRFDDEFTRFALYRNFYDPYQREWQNGNSRWDVIDMLRLTRALRPGGINWPDHEDGRPSFKLEDLSAANKLQHDAAHDALSDVTATIELARLVRRCQPRLYDYVYSNRGKHQVARLIDLQSRKPFLHVSARLPVAQQYLALMMPLAPHPVNKNAIIAVDLSQNPETLLNLDVEALRERVFTPAADLPEGEHRVALKGIHLNRCPVVATAKLLDTTAAARLGIDLEACHNNWLRLRDADLSAKVAGVFSASEFPPTEDAEQALYEGFLGDDDRARLSEIRGAEPASLGMLAESFSDPRYNELLFLYRARYAESSLDKDERRRWRDIRSERLIDGSAGFLTMSAYFEELDALDGDLSLSDDQRALLPVLRDWGRRLLAELAAA